MREGRRREEEDFGGKSDRGESRIDGVGVRVEVMPRQHGPGGLELFRIGDSRGAFRTRQYGVRGRCRVSERREEG